MSRRQVKTAATLGPQGWFARIEPGQLVIAGNHASRKFHIVRLVTRGDTYDSRQGKPGKYTTDLLDFSHCWDARSLCGVRATKTTFGNRTSYYWEPRPAGIETYDDELCKECRAVQKRTGEKIQAQEFQESEWELPFGWRAVPLVGHPYDVPQGGDVEKVRDGTGEIVGELRKEIARWQRGNLIVRICQLFSEKRYGVYTHRAGRPLGERWQLKAGRAQCMRHAHTLMAQGGS